MDGLGSPKTMKNLVLSTMFGFSAKRDFRAFKSAPRAAQESAPRAPRRPKGHHERPQEPKGHLQASKSHFGANLDFPGSMLDPISTDSAASSRQCSSPSSRGLGRATQHGPTEVQEKLSKRAFQKVFQPTCRPMCRAHVPLAVVVDLRRSNGQ